jgi:transcriptional regulator EpsA
MHTETAGFRVVGSGTRQGHARVEHPELRVVGAQPARAAAGAPAASLAATHGTGMLDAQNLEGLLLNLDASLRVTTRAQFFTWSQGLLLNLIRHRVLLCALRRGGERGFVLDSFSTLVANSGVFGELLGRDASLVPVLADRWAQRHFQPLACGLAELADVSGSAGLRELAKAGAAELLVHGCHDADGEVVGLTVFACHAGSIGQRELYLAQLLNPSLHTAWVRTQTRKSPFDERASASGNGCILTERERGILRWVYLGKSNGEIGAILGISALTVKNHVQKILRKLNVVNRAQAVGRALDARIIRP